MIKNYYIVFILCFITYACNDDEKMMKIEDSLATLVAVNDIEIDNVIACASGSKTDENTIIAYLYPRSGATDIRYYETESIEDDKNDYTKYKHISISTTDLFNGYLKKFSRITTEEKWVIITFFEEGKLHLSNPIRLKHLTKPTEFTENIAIDSGSPGMPIFNWEDGAFDDNKIYFQVISDANKDLLSGTYTVEKQFQFYKLDNVVLNITQEIPATLASERAYNITLMGVSEDNWVNLFIEKSFMSAR